MALEKTRVEYVKRARAVKVHLLKFIFSSAADAGPVRELAMRTMLNGRLGRICRIWLLEPPASNSGKRTVNILQKN